jgi:hypothetical protein
LAASVLAFPYSVASPINCRYCSEKRGSDESISYFLVSVH